MLNTVCTSSKLNSTPPIGAPNATETPAAEAADKTYKIKIVVFKAMLFYSM